MRRLFPMMLVAAALTGCAANDAFVQRQSSMEGRLEQVMQAQNSTKAELATLTFQHKELKDRIAKQVYSEKESQIKYDALQDRVRLLAIRLEQVEAPRRSSVIELVNQDSPAEGREESVQAAYMKAFGLFSANSFRAAAEAFETFIASYPESEYAANARYWLAECFFSEERYKEAIAAFTKVLESKPSEKRGADAMLRIGISWYKLNEPGKGEPALRALIEKYPGSEAALQAKEQLDRK